MWAAAAWQKSVKTRKAFPASQSFTHSSATTCCTLTPSAHMGAWLRGSMEREGMLVRSIYYGRIGSIATERLLETFGHDGSFLLRDSETVQGAYCLCVRWAEGGVVKMWPKVTFFVQSCRTLVSLRSSCLFMGEYTELYLCMGHKTRDLSFFSEISWENQLELLMWGCYVISL